MLTLLLRTRCIIYGSAGAPDPPDMHDIQENLPVVQSCYDDGAGVQSMLSILNILLPAVLLLLMDETGGSTPGFETAALFASGFVAPLLLLEYAFESHIVHPTNPSVCGLLMPDPKIALKASFLLIYMEYSKSYCSQQ